MDGGIFNNGIQMPVQLQKVNEPVNWQQVRIQAAIAAMQGMLIGDTAPHDVALSISAVELADALVEELKKGDDNADV